MERLGTHSKKCGSGHLAPPTIFAASRNEDSLGIYLRIEYISRYEVAHAET